MASLTPRISRLLTDTAEPTSYSVPRRISPRSMIDALVVVPPMSSVMTFRYPRSFATRCAATTPAAGPDSMIVTGRAAAEGALINPPFDCMTRSGARTSHFASDPRSRSR